MLTVQTHEHHARLRRILLDAERLRTFLRGAASVGVQQLEFVPYKRFMLAHELDQAMGGDFGNAIRGIVRERSLGGLAVGVQGTTSNADDFIRFGTAIAHLLGGANFDAMAGKFYARVVVEHTAESDSYLGHAYHLLTLHTDGAYVKEPTDWLLMMKFAEQHAHGGDSRLIHLDDWSDLSHFAEHPIGSRPILYRSPPGKKVAATHEHPTFFRQEDGWCANFIDQFAYPRTIEEARYLADLSQSLESSPATIALPIPIGDLVLLNNAFWMHGRAPFRQDGALRREIMRLRGIFATPEAASEN